MKLAICNEFCEGWTIEKVLAFAARTGYAGVELAPYTLATDVRTLTRERRREIAARAADAGVAVIGTSVAQGVELCREIDHPCFRLHLDVLAMCDEGRPLDELVRSAKGYVAHVHANDVNGGYPGSGQTDLAPAIRALKEIGYDGWLSVEVFDFGPGPETIATQSHAYLRRLLDNP